MRGQIAEQNIVEAVCLTMKGSCEAAIAISRHGKAEPDPLRGATQTRRAAGMVSPVPADPVQCRAGCTVSRGWKSGDVLDGRYVLRELIGSGGMANVFAADQPSLGRSVAIKLLHPKFLGTPQLVRRVQEEAALACRVRDPHCVAVFDCGVLEDGTPYVVMEHVIGRTLGRAIAYEAISTPRAVDLFDQILAALAVLHQRDIIHGDVKSNNFLVEPRDGADHVILIDFGLARMVGEPVHLDLGAIAGTPEYMAPELTETKDPRPLTDLYGAGVILYELLTGTVPFTGRTDIEVLRRHAHDDVIPPSQRRPDRCIPPALDRIVLRALDKRPEARFPDAESFACAMRAAVRVLYRSWRRPRGRQGAHGINAEALPSRGTAVPHREHAALRVDLRAARRAIGRALRRGDVEAIADGYLAFASALVRVGRSASAARELQEGIDLLAGGCSVHSPRRNMVDRLGLALAALHERAGKRQLACSAAAATDDRPTATCAIDGSAT